VALDRHLGLVLCVAYFPIDWWPFSARAWRRAAPDLAVVTEGERWPEHMRQAAARRVPVLCINARISDRSFRRLSLVRPAAAFVLAGMDRVLAGSAQDAGRFRELGFPAGRITVTGNIKLDVDIAALPEQARAALRRELGLPDNRLVLLGSSTWPGEEEALLGALRHARARAIACSLLIVPRHAERRADVERLLRASGFAFHLRSLGAAPSEVDVCLADTTGELRTLTQVADLVFVGKSLPPHTQGQTPVEAAALGKPIIVGPGTGNFREIASDLVRRGAARRVSDAADLSVQVAALLGDPSERAALADAAAGWRRENRGGVGRTLEAIRAELGRPR
jgi:3-deoxy-D-manno-octulosonic-acid transferase